LILREALFSANPTTIEICKTETGFKCFFLMAKYTKIEIEDNKVCEENLNIEK